MAVQLDKAFIGIIVFVFFILGGLQFVGNLNSSYNVNITDPLFDELSEHADTIHNSSSTLNDAVFGGDVEESSEFVIKGNSIASGLSTVREGFGVVGSVINLVATRFNLPNWVASLGFTAFLISVVFAMIYLFLRFRP